MENDLTIQLKVLSSGVDKIDRAKKAVRNLGGSMKQANTNINNFGKTLESTGSRLHVLGQRMTWMVTMPLLLFANRSIKTALEVEKAWLRMKKVFDGTEQELGELEKTAWSVAKTYGVTFEEATEAMTEFSKAGIKSKKDLEALTHLTAKTAIVFDTDMTGALLGVKSIMFGFGLTVAQTAQELDAINIIADKTTASEAGVLSMLQRVAGTARAAGFSIREVAAAQAVFEASAIPAGRAGNAMKSILVSLTKQSNTAKDQFAKLGVSMTSLEWQTSSGSEKLKILAKKMVELKKVGDKKVLKKFNEELGEMSETLEGYGFKDEGPTDKLKLLKAAMIEAEKSSDGIKLDEINNALNTLNVKGDNSSEKIENLDRIILDLEKSGRTVELHTLNEALATLVGKFQINNLNILLQDLSKEFDGNAATSSIFAEALNLSNDELENAEWNVQQINKVLDSNVVKVAGLEQAYREQATVLGNELLPYKIKLMNFLIGLLEKFNNLDPATREWILKLAGVVAVLGPLLSMVGLSTTGLGFLLSATSKVTGGIGTLMLKLTPLGKTLGTTAKIAGTSSSTGLAGSLGTSLLGSLTLVTAYLVTKAIITFGDFQEELKKLKVVTKENTDRNNRMKESIEKIPDGPYKEKLEGMRAKAEALNNETAFLIERYKGWPGVSNAFYDWVDETESLFGRVADAAYKAWENIKKTMGEGAKSSKKNWEESKHASGGVIYAAQGFFSKGKDTVPAMLTPGEMVLNQSQQANLFDMISGKTSMAGAGGPVVNINVGTMVASRGEQRNFARKIKELLTEDENRY